MRIQNSSVRPRHQHTSLNSHQLRNGLVQSLQPLHERFPSLVPRRQTPLMLPIFSSQPYSLGLQPFAYNVATLPNPMAPRDFHSKSLLVAASIAPPVSALKLLLAFVAGGLLFSTAMAGIAACYAMGMDNFRRLLDILGVVLQRVWFTFSLGMGATRVALLGEELQADIGPKNRQSWKWKSAWQTLKEQLVETRRTAAEGVKALRQEANLYAAAVGPPGLIPLQYMVDRLMPLSLTSMLEDSIRESLSNMPSQKTIKKMTLSSFSGGSSAPVLQAARVYDVEDAIAFDYDVKWESDIEATVKLYTIGGIARVPVSLKDFSFEGVVRIILAPLTKTSPGYGATLLSLPAPPKMNVNVKVLGSEVTRLPFLRAEITSAMQKAIADELLWPRRAVIPTMNDKGGTLLSAKQLKALETSDPLLAAEKAVEAAKNSMFRDVSTVARGPRTGPSTSDMVRVSVEEEATVDAEAKVVCAMGSNRDTMNAHFDQGDHHNVQKGVLWNRLTDLFQPTT